MKSVIFYTDNKIGNPMRDVVRRLIAQSGLPIVSSSLKPIPFGQNEVYQGERSYPTMVGQIISCLERSNGQYIFFCEHDVLYPKSHFDFTPLKDDIFYYNKNIWRWMYGAPIAIQWYRMTPLSSLCVNREFALAHYKMRQKRIQEMGWDKERSREPRWARLMGYEPGTKKIRRGGFTDDDFDTWDSAFPIIDIRHKGTFSNPKVTKDSFKHAPVNWTEIPIEEVPGWDLKGLFL